MITHEQYVTVLEVAASETIGLVLMASDPAKVRMGLYQARASEKNPAYADLQFRMWPEEDGNLVICHSQKAPRVNNNLGDIDLGGILDLDLDIP